MTEPLRGSVEPQGRPARLLGAEEVEALEAQAAEAEDEEEETEDDPRTD